MAEQTVVPEPSLYGEFSGIFKEDGKWALSGYKLPDGTFSAFSEPDAVIIIQRSRLRVRVDPLTHSHDTIQRLDDAKHLYHSTDNFPAPDSGKISFELQMGAKITGGKGNDLYNGFAIFGLSDPKGGLGFGFLTNGAECATLYSRQTPHGFTSQNASYPRFFAIHDEHPLPTLPEGLHTFAIGYEKQKNQCSWYLDGQQVGLQDAIPDPVDSFTLELGLMTGIEIGESGSRSLQGQGLTGEWTQVKITQSQTEL